MAVLARSSGEWVGVTCLDCDGAAEYEPEKGPGTGWIYHAGGWLCPSCVERALVYGAEANEEAIVLRKALEAASKALMDARNGLDLGLGCARDLEGDDSPRAVAPRSTSQEAYLYRARAAHRAIREALGEASA